MTKHRIIITALLALWPVSALASTSDQPSTDTQLWTEIGGRVKLTKKLRLSVAQLTRFDQNISRLGKGAPEVQLSYRLPKGFRAHGGYRFTSDRRDEGDWRFEHRFFIGARYSYDLGPIDLGYRLEFREDLYEKAGKNLNDNVLRNRLKAAYTDFDIEPFLSFELLTNLAGSPGTGMRDWRGTVGVEFEVAKIHDIELLYRLRRSFADPIDTDHIIGVSYRLDLGTKKKKSKKSKKSKKGKKSKKDK